VYTVIEHLPKTITVIEHLQKTIIFIYFYR